MCLCCSVLRSNVFASLRLHTSSLFCYPGLNLFRIFLPAGKMEWHVLLLLSSHCALLLMSDTCQVLMTVTKCKSVIASNWIGWALQKILWGNIYSSKTFPLSSRVTDSTLYYLRHKKQPRRKQQHATAICPSETFLIQEHLHWYTVLRHLPRTYYWYGWEQRDQAPSALTPPPIGATG